MDPTQIIARVWAPEPDGSTPLYLSMLQETLSFTLSNSCKLTSDLKSLLYLFHIRQAIWLSFHHQRWWLLVDQEDALDTDSSRYVLVSGDLSDFFFITARSPLELSSNSCTELLWNWVFMRGFALISHYSTYIQTVATSSTLTMIFFVELLRQRAILWRHVVLATL